MTKQTQVRILFAERTVTGHRLSYVRLLAGEALSRGNAVYLALPEGSEHSPEFSTHLADIASHLIMEPLPSFNVKSLAELTHSLEIDRTVVMDGDLIAREIATQRAWTGRGRLSILIMRERAQSDVVWPLSALRDLAKRIMITLAGAHAKVDLSILKSATWRGKSTHAVALDPIELRSTDVDVARTRELWDLGHTVYWFAVLGAITERKNVPLVAKALSSLPSDNVGLIVAGRIDVSVRTEVDTAIRGVTNSGKRAVIVDRTLTDVELDAAVSAADCLILAHSNEGPSGLLGKAILAGTRVVAAGAQSLRADIAPLDSSAEWTYLDVAALGSAMERATVASPANSTTLPGTKSFIDALLPAE